MAECGEIQGRSENGKPNDHDNGDKKLTNGNILSFFTSPCRETDGKPQRRYSLDGPRGKTGTHRPLSKLPIRISQDNKRTADEISPPPNQPPPKSAPIENAERCTILQEIVALRADMLAKFAEHEQSIKQSVEESNRKWKADMEAHIKAEVKSATDEQKDAIIDIIDKRNDKRCAEIKTKIDGVNKASKELKLHLKNLDTMKMSQTRLKYDNEELQQKVRYLEEEKLKKNLIFSGLDENRWESSHDCLQLIYDVLEKALNDNKEEKDKRNVGEIQIVNCHRLGKHQMGRKRPIRAEFQTIWDKDEVFANKKNMPKGIYVDLEFTQKVKRECDLLRPIMKAAQSIDEYKGKCTLRKNELRLLDKGYTIDTLDQLPPNLTPFTTCQKSDANTIVYFGELHPFSNSHVNPFTIDGEEYETVEHYFQYEKALHFGDAETASLIKTAKTAAECKKLAYKIHGFDTHMWDTAGKAIMLKGVTAKFEAHPILLETLKVSGTKRIAEASRDNHWGTGIPLHSPDCLNTSKWNRTGGVMSEILSSIRSAALMEDTARELEEADPDKAQT